MITKERKNQLRLLGFADGLANMKARSLDNSEEQEAYITGYDEAIASENVLVIE